MKKLLILSGKGGTGKTTTAAAFINYLNAKAFADCDVDAPNLHIVSKLSNKPEKTNYYGSKKAVIDTTKCISCSKCFDNCRFEAIKFKNNEYVVDEFACEGCGVCEYVCPQQAVTLQDDVSGELTIYKGERVFSTAILKMGRGNSGKLVTKVKTNLEKTAVGDIAIIDGSPGIGCPVIASMSGVDLVLIVAEPSQSGFSDMQRIVKTAIGFNVKVAVCVNKYDVNENITKQIEEFCLKNNLEFTGKIPYDKQVLNAVNNNQSIAEINCDANNALKNIFNKTVQLI